MDVLLAGNIVLDAGVDELPLPGVPEARPPLYKWALWYDEAPVARNVRVQANILHPGRQGVSNRPPTP